MAARSTGHAVVSVRRAAARDCERIHGYREAASLQERWFRFNYYISISWCFMFRHCSIMSVFWIFISGIKRVTSKRINVFFLFFLGGVEKTQYGQLPKQILSRHGFEGCLASLDLSGESTDLITDAVVPSSLVTSGCDIYTNLHPGKKCTHDLCANHGTCVQQWNSYTCDCDMTSFTGPTCNDGKETRKECTKRPVAVINCYFMLSLFYC